MMQARDSQPVHITVTCTNGHESDSSLFLTWRLWPLLGLSACATAPTPVVAPVAVVAPNPVGPASVVAPGLVAVGPTSVGLASWYRSGRGLHRTCSGELLDNEALTAASPFLPIGTTVRVARLDGSAYVVLTINDRMPRGHRILDVTELAARKLGLLREGLAQVSVTPVTLAEN